MKKLLLIISLLLSLEIQAQKGLTLGGQVGVDLAGLRVITEGSDKYYYFDVSPLLTYNANVYLKLQGNGSVGVSIEPGIIRKGFNQDGHLNSPDLHYKLTYLTMPLLINFKIIKTLSIGIGPEASYLIGIKLNDTKGKVKYIHYKRFEIAGLGGIDCGITPRLYAALRYSYGLSVLEDIALTNNTGNETGRRRTFNQVLQLSLRYNFIKPD